MKRDMDLARRILLAAESRSELNQCDTPLDVPGYPYDQVVYHIQLLNEAGLLVAHDWSDSTNRDWRVERLTWDGHEFLDASRDDTRWEAAKRSIASKAGEVGFDVLRALLSSLAMRAVGLEG